MDRENLGKEIAQDQNRWVGDNVWSSTFQGRVPISDIFNNTGNKIPFVCGDGPDWLHYANGINLQEEIPEISRNYPGGRWPRASYAWLEVLYHPNHIGNTHIQDMQGVGDSFRFTEDNLPELGDTLVMQFSNNVADLSGANHVVSIVEVHGDTLDKIMIFEGNPAHNTSVIHSLDESLREAGDVRYIIYGYPNLPSGGTP